MERIESLGGSEKPNGRPWERRKYNPCELESISRTGDISSRPRSPKGAS